MKDWGGAGGSAATIGAKLMAALKKSVLIKIMNISEEEGLLQ
jgi:hypothetical protein